ncbi:MAG: succinate dehydrogenase iron-sulfur subunit [Legionellaceae bacterium]|nr:succinate dehydrogenase iron-sulfur subunit [Legionellaceae bacterium]
MTDSRIINLSIYRYNPETDEKPYMKKYELSVPTANDPMLLTLLERLKAEQDPTLSFRRSCREGVCGSDGMNINGTNGLACVTSLSSMNKTSIVVRPLTGFAVVRDLIVDMSTFFKQYERIKPYLQNDTAPPEQERLQSPQDRAKLDGLYECIMCGCCTSSCPSFWWNPDKFVGPAGLVQARRFLADSRDTATEKRLEEMQDPFSVFRCRSVMNCASVCPKGLNPTHAISEIRKQMLDDET